MAAIVNDRDVLLQAASPRILPVIIGGNVTVPPGQLGNGSLPGGVTVPPGSLSGGTLPGTVAVPALNVTGTIQTTQLSAAVVTTLNLSTQNLSANQIVSGTINTSRLAADVITTGNFYAQTINASQIVTGTLSASRIYGGQLNGVTIKIDNGSLGYTFEVQANGNVLIGSCNISTINLGFPDTISSTGQSGLGMQVGQNLTMAGYLRANGRSANDGATLQVEAFGPSGNNHALRAIRRNTSGGAIVSSAILGQVGGFAVYAETYAGATGYGPFTAGHEALIPKEIPTEIGMLLDDDELVAARDISNTLLTAKPSSMACSKRSAGVVAFRRPLRDAIPAALIAGYVEDGKDPIPYPVEGWDELCERYDLVVMNALGDGQVLACGRNGDIEAGDLLCSSDLPGVAQRQGAEYLMSWTIAKARVAVTFDYPDQVKLVPLFYKCG